MSRPRRGLPADDEQFGFEETELEISAVRRGLHLDDDNEVGPARRASRAAPEQDEGPDIAAVDLQPSPPATRASAPAKPLDSPAKPVDSPAKAQPAKPSTAPLDKPKPSKPPQQTKQPITPAARKTLIGVALAAVGALATSFGIGLVPAETAPRPETVPLVTAISRTCPVADGRPSTLSVVSSAGDIKLRAVGQTSEITEPGPLSLPEQTAPVVISPTEAQASVTGGSVIIQDNKMWWGICRAALADQYVQLPGGEGAKLLLINPEATDAMVDLTLTGPDGEITGEGLRGLTIAANSQQIIDLADHAGDIDAVGARVRSSIGRVTLAAQIERDEGADYVTRTVQSTSVTIPAVPAEAERTLLLLTNPGTNRNSVQIEGVSEAGRFILEGYEAYPLDAQRTIALDLTEVLEGAPVGLVITGGEEFAASAVITRYGDFGIEPGQTAEQIGSATELVSVIPGPGVLQLANPGQGEALVTIDWGADQAEANRTIAPGSTVAVEIPAGSSLVRINSTSPVAGALLLKPADSDGFAIATLHEAARSRASMPMEIAPGMGR